MEDIIDIIVTETTNLITITSSGSDEVIDVNIIDNREDIVLNVTPSVVEININSLTSNFGVSWGQITGTLSNQTDLNTALGLKADLVGGKVPSSQLPSYVDDVVEVANYAALPATGETGKIYITLDTNFMYRWSGSTYIEIKDSSAVWGAITGTLSSQTDLQTALDAKQDDLNGTGFVKASGTTITYDNTTYYPASNPNGYTTNVGTVTSVAMSVPSAFSVSGSPITTSGTLAVTATGDTTQYIAGDGSLITFPIAGQAGSLVREVRNTTGATLTKGTIVYISGATGNKPTVSKAIATGDSTSAQTFGMLQANIANNANGYAVCVGDLTGLDTSAFTEGNQLYLSSTTAGTYTTTKQLAPAHLVYIGIVTRAHPTQGQIEVNIQNGYELYELHDVSITSEADNQGLFYELSTDLWKNKSIATVLGYSPEQPLTFSSPLSRATNAVSIPAATTSVNGYLTSTDWTTFNAKQAALSGTGFVKISGTTISYDNSTYLTTSSAASTYLALAGGTMTGAIVGTTATFSNAGSGVALGVTQSGASGDGIRITHSLSRAFTIQSSGSGFGILINNDTASTSAPFTIQKQGSAVVAFTDAGAGSFASSLTATSFIKSSGTSSQFLKADGSVDSSTYLTTGTASSTYLPLAGGTLTGALNGTSALFSSAVRANNPSEGATGEGLIAGQSFKIDGTGTSQRAVMYMVSNVLSDTYASGLTAQFGNFAGDKGFAFNLNTSGGYELYVKNTTWNKALTISNTNAVTLTGALSGTSATFSGLINANAATSAANGSINVESTDPAIRFRVTSGSANKRIYEWRAVAAGGVNDIMQLRLWNDAQNSASTLFSVASTGAATFSGNVGIGGPSLGDILHIMRNGTSSYAAMRVTNTSSTADVYFGNGGSAVANTDLRNNAYVMNAAASSLVFGTSDAVRMTITSGGDVCIASTAPISTRRELRIGGNAAGSRISMGLNGTNYSAFVTDSGGNVYIANEYNDSAIKLLMINYNNGVYLSQSATSWTSNSDERLKTDLVAIENATEKVASLRSVIGRYKTDDESKRRPFLIAQDVYSVLPEAVDIDKKTGMMGVQYTEVIPLLVASIKELKAELDTLKNK